MEISETKKSKKYATLVTYLAAIVCMLLGLFLPLFNGNGILALYLPDVFNHLTGNEIISTENKLELAFNINAFGVSVDIMAYVILLYAVVTVLGLLALVPIGLIFKKESKIPVILEYAILTAASLVLPLYLIMALQLVPVFAVSINLIIALGGSLLALVMLSLITKKGLGFVKTILGILSAVALLLLFDLTVVIPSLAQPLEDLGNGIGIFPALFRANDINYSGISSLTLWLAGTEEINLTSILNATENVAEKITYCIAAAAAIIVIINFLIDVISLAANGKKVGIYFNLIRYGLAFLILVVLLILIAVSHFGFGLFAIALTVVVTLQLLISIFRFIIHLKNVKEKKRDEDFERTKIKFIMPAKQPNKEEPAVQAVPAIPEFVGADPIVAQTIDSPVEQPQNEQMAFIDPAPEIKQEPEVIEPLRENPDEVQMIMDGIPEIAETAEPEDNYEKPVYIAEEEASEPQPEEEPEVVEPVQPVEPVLPVEPVVEQPVYQQPVQQQPVEQSVAEQPVEEPVQKVEQPAPAPAPAPVRIEVQQQPAQRPYVDKRIYTEMYERTDSFLNKLTESEKTEFTRTFIERANGDVGNMPEYVIGGNNKKFFSAVFIYLGRIRGLISDGLLNKMFKELNML